MSNKIDACKIDSVHVYEVEIFNPHINYTAFLPLTKAKIGYRLGDLAMGSNTFEGLGAVHSESPYDEEIQELTVKLIQAIENNC